MNTTPVQAEHAAKLLDGLVADYLRELSLRGQNQTAQALLPVVQEAARTVFAFIKEGTSRD